jgi:hypothetical protein
VNPKILQDGFSYETGDWVYTPIVGSGPESADPLFFYVDPVKGAVSKYAYVESNFTFASEGRMVKDSFDNYVSEGILKEVSVREGENGLPIRAFSPRFEAGEYLEYRESSSAEPYFYVATKPFTPGSNKISDLLSDGVVIEVAETTEDRSSFLKGIQEETLLGVRRMFSFFKGDQTLFRSGSKILVFAAKENVSPIFDFEVYLENGIFEEIVSPSGSSVAYVPFFRRAGEKFEDILIDENGKNLYRVMRAFVPSTQTEDQFGNTRENTARIEEINGNLLRIVRAFDCSDQLINNLGDITSMKLGEAVITLQTASSTKTFVWGSTNSPQSSPELLFEGRSLPGTIDYKEGTFAL